MAGRLAVLAGMLALSGRIAVGQGSLSVSNGVEALIRRDLPSATRYFRLAAVDSNPSVRSAAERWLGHLSWMANADAKAASTHLDRALIPGGDSTLIIVERAHLLAFERRYRDGTHRAAEALRGGGDEDRRGVAARAAIEIATGGAFAAMRSEAKPVDSLDVPSIRDALDTLRQRVARFPGRTNDALALIEAGALLWDVDAIRAGWTSYFLLTDDSTRIALDRARRLIAPDSERLRPQLNQPRMAAGLVKSRLYEPAAVILEQMRRSGHPLDANNEDTRSYGLFLHELRIAIDETYRRELTGAGRQGDLDRVVTARTRALWASLHWPDAVPPFYPAAIPGELAKRFGTVMGKDRDNGTQQLHFAHAIASFVARDSGGRIGRRFVILDAVVSNGVDAWLLQGTTGRAGWVSGDSIFQIRPAFTERPFREWIALTEPRATGIERIRIERDSITDEARARADSAGYLPGIAQRLFRDGARVIVDSLASSGLAADQRQAAFVDVLFRQLIETTIIRHETRHLLDTRVGRGRADEFAEFRAKIDEVAGTTRPKLALTAIMHPNIGAPTSHGRANRRIMLGLIRWMRANAASIGGFDSARPVLTQLPLLSDSQLRAAFESMRPVG